MKLFLTVLLVGTMASPAAAHIGHLGEVAGHDHWAAGVAIGVAGAITLASILKGKAKPKGKPQTAEDSKA